MEKKKKKMFALPPHPTRIISILALLYSSIFLIFFFRFLSVKIQKYLCWRRFIGKISEIFGNE